MMRKRDALANQVNQLDGLPVPFQASKSVEPRKVTFEEHRGESEERETAGRTERGRNRSRSYEGQQGRRAQSQSQSPHRSINRNPGRDGSQGREDRSRGFTPTRQWTDALTKQLELVMGPMFKTMGDLAKRQKEERQYNQGETGMRGADSQEGNAGVYRGNDTGNRQYSGYRRQRVPPGDGCCRNCGTYGHYANECRKSYRPMPGGRGQYQPREGYQGRQEYGGRQYPMLMPRDMPTVPAQAQQRAPMSGRPGNFQ
jgi:hypothetical protein